MIIAQKNCIGKEMNVVGAVGTKVFLKYLKYFGLRNLTLIIGGNILAQVCQIYSTVWLSKWAVREDSNEAPIRNLYLSIYAMLGLGQGISI